MIKISVPETNFTVDEFEVCIYPNNVVKAADMRTEGQVPKGH